MAFHIKIASWSKITAGTTVIQMTGQEEIEEEMERAFLEAQLKNSHLYQVGQLLFREAGKFTFIAGHIITPKVLDMIK